MLNKSGIFCQSGSQSMAKVVSNQNVFICIRKHCHEVQQKFLLYIVYTTDRMAVKYCAYLPSSNSFAHCVYCYLAILAYANITASKLWILVVLMMVTHVLAQVHCFLFFLTTLIFLRKTPHPDTCINVYRIEFNFVTLIRIIFSYI